MILNYLLNGRDPDYEIRKISVVRYWKELVADPMRQAQLDAEGRSVGPTQGL
jgi:hypothetical protein